MATYTETFTGSNGASWPAAWTTGNPAGGGTIDIQSNRGRMLTGTANFNTCQATLGSTQWDEADGEVYVEFTIPSGSLPQLNVVLRSDGGWGLTDVPSNAYIAQVNMPGGSFNLAKTVGGSFTQLGSSVSLSFATGVTYAMRFQTVGTAVRLKVWSTAGSEPGVWSLDETDSSITGAGQTGMSARTLTGAVARTVVWDNFTVTTGDEDPPDIPDTDAETRVEGMSPPAQNYTTQVDLIVTSVTVPSRQRVYWRGQDSGAGFIVEVRASADQVEVYRRDHDGSRQTKHTDTLGVSVSTVVHVKIETAGSSHRVKWWLDAASEPSGWDVEFTDTVFQDGWIGLGAVAPTNATFDFDNFELVS